MSSDTSLAGGLFDVLLGAALVSVGAAVARDWRGWTRRYTDFVDDALPATRRSLAVDRSPRLLRQNRIIFGVIAAFGIMLLIAGVAGLAG